VGSALTRTTKMFPPGSKVTLLPSGEATKTFPVWTPAIVSVMFGFGFVSVALAVVEIALVAFRFATVKFAVITVPLMMLSV